LYHLRSGQVLLMDCLHHPCLQKINYVRTFSIKKVSAWYFSWQILHQTKKIIQAGCQEIEYQIVVLPFSINVGFQAFVHIKILYCRHAVTLNMSVLWIVLSYSYWFVVCLSWQSVLSILCIHVSRYVSCVLET
jgi:hypothetical protein